jgi:hypothetical protein
MIMTLLNSQHTVPTLLLMLPVESKSLFGKVKGMFQTEVKFGFVCPVTKKPVSSGPNGKGYVLKVISLNCIVPSNALNLVMLLICDSNIHGDGSTMLIMDLSFHY